MSIDSTQSIQWQLIFNAIAHPAIILDREHRVVAANGASLLLTGMLQDELIGRYCFDVFHDKTCTEPAAGCPMEKMLQSGGMESVEMELESQGRIYLVSCTPVHAADDSIDMVIHIATDITAHKKVESELLEQRHFINSLVRNSPVAMFVLDNQHQVQVWNTACEHLTGCLHSDMLGTKDHWRAFYVKKQPCLADVVLDGDLARLPKLYTHVARSINNQNGYRAEGWFVQVNGKDRYFMIEAAPIYDSQGNRTHVLESISDLTDSKSLEEQLLQAQKMESIGHLSGGIAHEFNNILAVILGYGQVLANGFEPDSLNMSDLNQILTAAERAAVLTKGLLAFSRKQHVSLKNLDLNILVHTTLKSFTRILGDDINIEERLDSDPMTILADQAQLTQVIMNLMVNARDAMPNGGTLNIHSCISVLDKPYSTPLCLIPVGTYARLTIADSGHGIDAQNIQKIFEPFFTTKDIGKGTGLGLSVVYGIISQHNGYICVSSAAGQGTAFDLYFPLIEQAPATQSAIESSTGLRGGDETILLADDESTLLDMFSSLLSEMGYHVITASDGVDAVEKFAANRDTINLLILDVQMSRKSGLQAYKEMKLLQPECRALFISGFNVEQFQGDMALEAGTELLTKPFTPFDLAVRIRKMLDAAKS